MCSIFILLNIISLIADSIIIKKLVTIAKKEVERHRIMQIFFSTTAYLFVYDLDSLPKSIARYFYPVSLERARVVIVSLLMLPSLFLSSFFSASRFSIAGYVSNIQVNDFGFLSHISKSVFFSSPSSK